MSIFLSCLSVGILYGQDSFVQMHLSKTKLLMKNGEIESVTMRIENRTTRPFSGQVVIKADNGIAIVSKNSQRITLEAGASKYISAQVLMEKSAEAGEKRLSFRLEDEQKRHLTTQSILVTLLPVKSMRTEILSTISLLPAIGNILDIPVRVINSGNIDQTVELIASFPLGTSGTNNNSNKSYSLFVPSYSDTIINITRKITRAIAQQDEFKINIIGMYKNGDFFSSQTLNLFSPKSHVRYNQDTRPAGSNQNHLTAGIMNLGTVSEAHYLRANIDFQQGKTKGGLHLDMVNWPNGLTIQNTWIDLEHNKIGARIGNLTKYGDQSLYGRGAEVFFNDTASGYSLAAGYIEKGYDLLNTSGFNLGDAYWISGERSLKNGSIRTVVTRDNDLYALSDNKTLINTASLNFKDNINTVVKLGLGHTKNTQDASDTHPSILVEGAITAKLAQNILLNSTNSYASAYFPGTKRGTVNIGQRVSWTLPTTTLWASYRYYNFAPKYLQATAFFSNNTSNHHANIGASGTIGSFNYSAAPYYTSEKGSWNWMVPNDIRNLNGLGLNSTLSWIPGGSQQYFNLQLDGGHSWMDRNGEAGLQLRGTLNWSYNNLRLTSSAQTGSFYLYEAFRNQSRGEKTRYLVSPSYAQSFFRNRLRVEAGMMYILDREVTNLLYTGNVNYTFKSTELFGRAQVSRYGQSNFYQNFQIGITQRLPSFTRTSIERPGNIELLVFKDKNGNGIADTDEGPAVNHLVYINNKPFITDQKGQISYKKLPEGVYRIDAPVQDGWFTRGETTSLASKERRELAIPLQESGLVRGNVEFVEGNNLLEFSVNKSIRNLHILAVSENGSSVETRTDDTGKFILFLPPGSYTLSVIGLPESIESINDKQVVNVSTERPVEGIKFILRVKEQKVEIKRFSSN